MNLSLSLEKKTNLSLSTTKHDHCAEEKVSVLRFLKCKFFPAFHFNLDTYRVSPHIHSEREEIWIRMKTFFMQCTSNHPYIILIPMYATFIVTSWLNDCEDMKLVVPTHRSIYILYIYIYIYYIYIYVYIYNIYIFIYIYIYI